jgi:LuxR family maltose regulon positive regulatory protein
MAGCIIKSSMPIVEIATKFYFPPARQSLVRRPRLVQRLDRGTHQPLVLISAPAGYGKTTLLSEWYAGPGRDGPLAWLTLDPEDNDPIRFFTYFILALRRLKPGLGEMALSALQSPVPPAPRIILSGLINDLCEIPPPFVLVLDDYHVIEEIAIHQGITFLLDHLPSAMHLVLLTRADPPLPLARLRARNQICEIRTADLRFTPPEVEAFLNQEMKLGLSGDSIQQLELSTEGWIAGLQLAALSMQGRSDIQAFISSFTGSYHYIADFLVEEVLDRQPAAVKDFLLKTCVLERMNAGLCDALTSPGSAQAMLEKLEHNNLFIIPLDDQQNWYRYHHLFADLLQNRLWREHPELVPDLYKRAADWSSQNSLVPEAIKYAMAGTDFDQASVLLERQIPQMQRSGELKTLAGWLGRLPDDLLRQRPYLSIAYAWALAYSSGAPDKVEHLLQNASQVIGTRSPSAEARDLLGQIACIRANVAVFLGDNPLAIQLCAQAESMLAEENTSLRSYTALMEGDAYWMMGDGESAQRALDVAIRLSRNDNDLQTALTALNYQARLMVAHGKLRQAKGIYEEALQFANAAGGAQWPACGVILVGLGMLHWEQNDPGPALDCLTKGLQLAIQADDIDSLLFGYTALARVYRACGEVNQANRMLENAGRLTQETKLARDRYRVAARQAGIMLESGNLQEALQWSEELTRCVAEYSQHSASAELSPMRIADQIMQARIKLAQGMPGIAEQILSVLLPPLEASGRWRSVIEALALQAMACQAQGEMELAIRFLTRALQIAAPEGFVRLLVDEGKPVELLLHRIRAQSASMQAYVVRLLKAFEPLTLQPEVYETRPETLSQSQLIEPLSERELEVLGLVSQGYSNQDIARQLVIAVGTVKRHTANIFTKLDVRNRTEAVARARQLNLL